MSMSIAEMSALALIILALRLYRAEDRPCLKMGNFKNIRGHLKQKYLWFLDVPGPGSPDAFYIVTVVSLSCVSVYERLRARLSILTTLGS